MPATTLSPFLAADRASLSSPTARYHMYSPPHHIQDRDNHEGRRPEFHAQDIHAPFDASGRHYSTAVHISHNPLTNHDHLHSFPPPMQRTTGYAHWHAAHSHNLSYASSSHPTATGFLPPRMPPPPPILHKVWILDCQSCGTFLTNRGMKAVLLLRPNVPLYSTDALPINCSAQPMTATSSRADERAPRSSDSSPESAERTATVSRTCECLTQTLWCHGCGNGVGYMIVVPCIRCTSSMTVTNRTTNGHRFVFYSSEISARERYYVPGEAGIVSPAFSPSLHSSPPAPSSDPTLLRSTRAVSLSSPRVPSTPPRRDSHVSLLDSPSDRSRYRSTSPDAAFEPPYSPTLSDSSSASSMPPLIPASPSFGERTHPQSNASANFQEPVRLKAGDNLYWHHLTRSGEIPAVMDDPRARNPDSQPMDDAAADEHSQSSAIKAGARRCKLIPMAGR